MTEGVRHRLTPSVSPSASHLPQRGGPTTSPAYSDANFAVNVLASPSTSLWSARVNSVNAPMTFNVADGAAAPDLLWCLVQIQSGESMTVEMQLAIDSAIRRATGAAS